MNPGQAVVSGVLLLAAVALLASGKPKHALPAAPPELPVGTRLRPYALLDERGQQFDVATLRGAPTLLFFIRAPT